MSRILRTFVCFLLICCILVNLSPLKAHALDPVTVGFVGVSAVVGVACIMQALGYMAASNSEPFTNSVNACVDYLTESTSFVTNGMLTFAGYRSGQLSSMYAMRDLVQEVWQWLFDSNAVSSVLSTPSDVCPISGINPGFEATLSKAREFPYYVVAYTTTGHWLISWDDYPFTAVSEDHPTLGLCYKIYSTISGATPYYWRCDFTNTTKSNGTGHRVYSYTFYESGVNDLYFTSTDALLGRIQSPYQTVGTDEEIIEIEIAPVYIDLTKKVEEFPDPNNPSDDPDLDKKIPWLPIRIPSKNYDDTVINQTQQESWTGESDVEFEFDYGDSSGNGSGNTGTDSGSTGNTGSSWKPPSNHSQFKLVDLSKFFPFCIPFDLFDFFKLLNADPVAPSFTWEIQDLSGQTYGLTVDLSQWDSVAQLFRRLQLFLFVCGLAAASRKYIKW